MSEAMRRGAVEARRPHKPEVAGSSPAAATTTGPCVALPHEATGRATGSPAPAPNGGPEPLSMRIFVRTINTINMGVVYAVRGRNPKTGSLIGLNCGFIHGDTSSRRDIIRKAAREIIDFARKENRERATAAATFAARYGLGRALSEHSWRWRSGFQYLKTWGAATERFAGNAGGTRG